MESDESRILTIDEVEGMGIKGFIESSLITRYVNERIKSDEHAQRHLRGGTSLVEIALSLNQHLLEQEEGADNLHSGVCYLEEADYENTLENLLRLKSITNALSGNYLMRSNGDSGLRYNVYLQDIKIGCLDISDRNVLDRVHYLFGPETSHEFRHSKETDWWKDETLNAATGRRIETAGLYPDDENHPHVYDLLRDYRDSGIERGFIKMTTSKTLAKKADLATLDLDREDPLDIYMMHLEGRSDVYIVQEFIEMRNEYRFMVVDGEIVSGAGCVSEFTPMDREPSHNLLYSILDTRVRFNRNSDIDDPENVVSDEPAIVSALYDKGIAILHEYEKKNGSVIFDGTLDMAMAESSTGKFDRPVLVEANGMSNAGLFANDPDAIAAAIVKRANDGRYDKVEDDLFRESSLNLLRWRANPRERFLKVSSDFAGDDFDYDVEEDDLV